MTGNIGSSSLLAVEASSEAVVTSGEDNGQLSFAYNNIYHGAIVLVITVDFVVTVIRIVTVAIDVGIIVDVDLIISHGDKRKQSKERTGF